ncbi:T9SS type A sorting domain-containing protein [Ignavibacterium sp.]|uniref:T9SS type A sorting domain-containing protein n=1 Tax=Ignavibacterium sp. TaxID=2651167 RepID=UPI00307D572D
MKKMFSFFFFTIFAVNVFAQQEPAVKVPITIDDGAGASKTLHFGLDPNATDGIDVQFGESDLPPYPPQGAFDTRFLLPENNFSGTLSSWDDYRQADLPFTGQKEHRLRYQPAFGTVINITWNFPHNSVTAVLQDIITGTLINVNLADSGSYTVTNPSVFDKLKLLVNYVNIIPVELSFFSASIVEGNVVLNWSTATELNNRNFEVQRKTENSDWQTLGYVDGHGTTTQPHSYSFVDKAVNSNIKYFYRLRQNDFDGKFSFSNVIEIDISAPSDYSLEQNYPNPFNPRTNISFSLPKASFVKLIIYNQLGEVVDQLVNQQLETGKYIYNWNAKSHSSGIYLYELQADGYKQTKKMSLLK